MTKDRKKNITEGIAIFLLLNIGSISAFGLMWGAAVGITGASIYSARQRKNACKKSKKSV